MNSVNIKRPKNYFTPIILLIVCSMASVPSLQAQVTNIEETRVTIDVKDEPLHKVLTYIEQRTSFRFAYNSDLILQQKNITLRVSNMKITDLLNALLEGTSITYNIIGNQIVLQEYVEETITIRGYVKDKNSGESLIGTSVFLPALQSGAASNNYGFYSLTVPASDSLEMEISYVGYQTTGIKINGRKDALLNFNLTQKEDSISPVRVLKDKREDNIKRNQIDLIDLSADMIATTASVTGNGDIISSIQLSAGVQAGLDGTSGYLVRGGNADQNQVLLDEATLYNPSHLFGLVSVFNSPAIKRASLIKGGFPAVYGDYLSSVLDVYMNDGSNQQFGGELQLGTIASSVELHSPLSSGKSSFLLSARRSAIDWTLRPFSTNYYFSNYYFYDVNAKLNFQLSSKDKLFMSYYRGSDNNSYTTDVEDEDELNYKISFGNQVFNMRWNHLFSKKLFSNISAVYSNYYQRLSSIQEDYFAQLYSGIRDINFKTDIYYYPHINHRIRGGLNYLLQSVFPATVSDKLSTTGFININQNNIPEKRHNRFAAYASDDIKVNRLLNIYVGARLPVFFKPGVRYINLEPRLSLLYGLNKTSSVKLAYSRM
ncbi:MAG TPA: TonB-dependent receptor, partial [Chitinophagaceae bacterium]|nr:TonB-dependent receptor [Chitinophagaceae bacterium]